MKSGDLVRVIAPSRPFAILSTQVIDNAVQRLQSLGLRVSFGSGCVSTADHRNNIPHLSDAVNAKIEELHAAFSDPDVKAILTAIGGFDAHQILPFLNYGLIRNNPKILIGYSDITVLQNAIWAKTGLITFGGPHFSTFAMKHGFEYTQSYFQKMLMSSDAFTPTLSGRQVLLQPSDKWRDDAWYMNQDNVNEHVHQGYKTILPYDLSLKSDIRSFESSIDRAPNDAICRISGIVRLLDLKLLFKGRREIILFIANRNMRLVCGGRQRIIMQAFWSKCVSIHDTHS